MIVTDIPIRLVDVGGAIMMIVLSFWCLADVRLKAKGSHQHHVGIFDVDLLWLCPFRHIPVRGTYPQASGAVFQSGFPLGGHQTL